LGETLTPNGRYVATAYSQSGKTASGVLTKRHIVAADPDYLPIGSRILIRHAGRYSGEYVVADTGDFISGRRLDIYLPSAAACKKFGRKNVKVKVISLGDNTRAATKEAQAAITHDVKDDLQKRAVGNAATQDDWTARKTVMKEADKTQKQTEGTSVDSGPPAVPEKAQAVDEK
jgi:3D (Asp-Asp-Asp) domain-containing protein